MPSARPVAAVTELESSSRTRHPLNIMNYRTLLVLLASLTTWLFSGCSSPAPLSRAECGPYPDNYAAIANDYATTTKILRVAPPGTTLSADVSTSAPELSKDRSHPGWLVRSQRKLTESSPGNRSEIQLPFSLIIYNGKIVWTSDEEHGVKLK